LNIVTSPSCGTIGEVGIRILENRNADPRAPHVSDRLPARPGVALAADEPYLDAEKLDITRFLSPAHTAGSPEDLADRAATAKAELRAAYGL
jgi:hypothetical protein